MLNHAKKIAGIALSVIMLASAMTFTVSAAEAPTISSENLFSGGIGLGTWATAVGFSSVKVEDNNTGEVLLSAEFDSNSEIENWNTYTRNSWDQSVSSFYTNDGELRFDDTSAQGAALWTGDSDWSDYTLTVNGTAYDGAEGLLIFFSFKDETNYYMFNIGGWANTQTCVECRVAGQEVQTPKINHSLERDTEYEIKVVVGKEKVEGFIDGESFFTLTEADVAHLIPAADAVVYTAGETFMGGIGVSQWASAVGYSSIKAVSKTTGDVLMDVDFDDPADIEGWNLYTRGAWDTEASSWYVENGELRFDDSSATGATIWTGSSDWVDYTLTVEGTLHGGAEGLGVYFGVKDDSNYHYLNLGGWGNTLTTLQSKINNVESNAEMIPMTLEKEVPYTIVIDVNKYSASGTINGEHAFAIEIEPEEVPAAEEVPVEVETVVEEVVVEEPTVEEPTVEELTVEEPTVEEPTVEELTVEEPTVEEPAETPVAPQTFDFSLIAAVSSVISAAGYAIFKKR